MNGGTTPTPNEDDVIDVALTPSPEPGGSGVGRAMAAVAVLAALILGAAFVVDRTDESDVASDGPAEVGDDGGEGDGDTSPTDSDATDDDGTGDVGEPSTETEAVDEPMEDPVDADFADETEAVEFENLAAAEEFALDSAFGGGGDQAIFDGERFVALGYGPDGRTLRTSTDGITWDEQPFPGIASEVNVNGLVEHDGLYATILETWPEGAWEEDYSPLDDLPTATLELATSTDLETWTRTELSVPQSKGRNLSVVDLALGDPGVVVVLHSYEEGPNEIRILIEAGILAESDWESYCGLDLQADSIDVQICDFAAHDDPDYEEPDHDEFERRYDAAETDEEREALEAEFDEIFNDPGLEVVATLTPADAIYGELRSIYEGSFAEMERTVALVGPVDGPLTFTDLPGGFASNVVSTSAGFTMISSSFDDTGASSAVYVSADGLVWSEQASLGSDQASEIVVVGNVLLMSSYSEFGDAEARRSVDGGATWDAVDVTELFGSHTQFVSGPAGVIAITEGSAEPTPGFSEPDNPIVYTRDGYELTVSFLGDAPVTLTGPDGQLIHEIALSDLEEGDGNIENVVRENPINGNVTFFDPETGEELVTFTEEDFAAAEGVDFEAVDESAWTREIRFSVDGLTWTTLDDDRLITSSQNSYIAPVAVGDDEVIFSVSTWNEPSEELFAFELENREPTEDEIQALEAWENSGGGESIEYVRIELG